MKHKTEELEGALLDVAVAKALGYGTVYDVPDRLCGEDRMGGVEPWMPSTNWAQGGTIIERERIEVTPEWETIEDEGLICAGWMASVGVDVRQWFGSDPLTAAMRAYVASRFGDEVELP